MKNEEIKELVGTDLFLNILNQKGSSKIKLEPFEWYIVETERGKSIVEFNVIDKSTGMIFFYTGCSLDEKYIYGTFIIHNEKFIKSIKKASINDVPEYFFQQFPNYRPNTENKKVVTFDKNNLIFNIMIASVLLNFIFLIVFIIYYT